MLVTKCETLIDTLVEATGYYMDYSYSITKPVWIKQVEQFSSFYAKIKDDDEVVTNFRTKVVVPFFEENAEQIVQSVANDKGVIQDKFLILTESNDEEITVNNIPKGLFFHVAKVYLPISQVYSEVKKLVKKRKDNVPHLENILMALYKVCLCLTEDEAQVKTLESNIELLTESLEVRDEPVKAKNTPVDMIQNMLGNINFDHLGGMIKQISSDETTSKEFNDIFGKVSESMAKGKNPLEAMNTFLTKAAVDINSGVDDDLEDDDNGPELKKAVTVTEPVSDPVVSEPASEQN